MGRKRFIITALTGILLVLVLFLVFLNEKHIQNADEKSQNAAEKQMYEEDMPKDEEEPRKAQTVPAVKEKIELMDYIELPIEEFMKETGIILKPDQEYENVWKTENGVIRVSVNQDKITGLSVSQLLGNDEIKQLIAEEGFPYTIAGVCLNDEISYLEKSTLKDACYASGGSGISCYTSPDLSKLGIEVLNITNMETVDEIYPYFDMSLKEGAEGLEYLWEEKVLQKEGVQNSSLETYEEPYAEMPEQYKYQEDPDKTFVWIKYPCIEIPGKPEMTQNANDLILETVERVEEKTYRKTDENIVVEAEYMITYMTSKFISITFRVDVSGNDDSATSLWQFCNINMAENGRGAVLADVGITRERVKEACSACGEPLDVEGYLETYDTSWGKFSIRPMEYVLFVKKQNEESSFDTVPIHKSI